MQVDDAQYARMRQGMAIAPYVAGAAILVFAPIMVAIISGILFAVFNARDGREAIVQTAVRGGRACRRRLGAGAALHAPLNYFRGRMSAARPTLAVLLPMIDEKSFVGRLLGMIDLFIVW